MFIDLVLPKNNEKEFIEIAEKLKIDGLCFVYSFKTREDFLKKNEKIKKLQEKAKPRLFTGLIADSKNISNAKKLAKIVIYKSTGNDRHAIEKSKASIIFGLETIAAKDSMHSRNSGLNQILCNLANKNNVIIGFSFSSILNTDGIIRSQILGRLMQNIRLCRKYQTKTIIASFAEKPYYLRSCYDLKSVFISIGMHPKEAKNSLENISYLLS
jgi:RNase P/RNase MRP subunit p30